MRVIKSSQLDDLKLDDEQRLWVYNGLDCALTHEIYSALLPQVDKHARRTYDFERGMAACAINLILRGWAVDKDVIAARTVELEASQKLLMAATNKIANAVWGKDINVNSPVQLKRILYEELAIPPQMRNAKGKMKVSTDREALEAVARQYPRGRPLALFVLAIRDTVKKLSVLKSTLDGDGRMRCSYNVAGTECLSGDTLVVTASGIRPLADIYNSTSYKTHLWNGNEFVNPVKKVCYKNTEGLEILLANGTTLRCSKNHPFAVERIGWVEARNLVLGQSLVNSIPNTLFGTVVTPYSKSTPVEFYELLGMLLADGTLHSSNGGYSIRISNRDPEVQARFVELVKYLFPEAVPRCYKDYAHVSHRPLYDMLEPVWATALSKTIPKWALRGTPIALRALLRGLTLDSHVTSKKNGLIFGSASDKLRTQIQTMLKYLGIESISYNFKLVLPRRETAKFLKLCGFVQSSKLDKVATLLNRFRKTSAEFNYNEVVAVKPWRGAVYDCTMPSSSPPQYSAAGLLVHNTGRWSSSSSPFNTGTNLQNVTKDLRGIFVPDPGYVLFDADLEQAESRVVAYLSEDEGYIKACEEGDLHTTVVKMIWPHRDWTGDLQRDRAMAEEKYYRDFSYRDICKRAGHGANYGLTVDSLARHLRIHKRYAALFQARYYGAAMSRRDLERWHKQDPDAGFDILIEANDSEGKVVFVEGAFPGIRTWHDGVAHQLETTSSLTTALGRRRVFLGRASTAATQREAIAYDPQSTIGDLLNVGLYRIWNELERAGEPLALFGQVHDSVVGQIKEKSFDTLVPRVLECLTNPLTIHGRTMVVPSAIEIGRNWKDLMTVEQWNQQHEE